MGEISLETTQKLLKDPDIRGVLHKATQGRITDLRVNIHGYVNFKGDLFFNNKGISRIPIPFGTVDGSFFCNGNRLQTLENAPVFVTGDFHCQGNQLQTLRDAPCSIGGSFYCTANPDLSEIEVRLYREALISGSLLDDGVEETPEVTDPDGWVDLDQM